MAIKVYGIPLSTCTARVLLCLSEKRLDYELLPVDVMSGAHRKQPYLSLNPFGQIPAFEDGDIQLFESRAISRYIANKYKDVGTDLYRSGDFTESTTVDLWMEVESQQFNPPLHTVVRQLIVNPLKLGLSPDEKIVEAELEKLGKVLDVYEERLSKSKYLAGDYYTLADLNHIPYLVYFMSTSHSAVVSSRPRVRAWWEDISSRPATVKVTSVMKLRSV